VDVRLTCYDDGGGNYLVGSYKQTYAKPPPTAIPGTNVAIAFNGNADPNAALSAGTGGPYNSSGLIYICLGGGIGQAPSPRMKATGRYFTATVINSIAAAINANMFANYQGIVFDIELGDPGLAGPFNAAFAAAKSKELDVVITTSHSAPFNFTDAAALMASFFHNPNIDYLSPQLYTSGTEVSNDFTPNSAVAWSQWSGPNRPPIIPSVVHAVLFEGANSFFQNLGLTVAGYFQWSQGPLQ
jgi:hypothetical protein